MLAVVCAVLLVASHHLDILRCPASCGIRLLSKVFGQNCSKTPNMGWIVDWRGWEGPEVPGMAVRFFPMAARSTVRGSQLEED